MRLVTGISTVRESATIRRQIIEIGENADKQCSGKMSFNLKGDNYGNQWK